MEKWFIRNKGGDIKKISEKFGISPIVSKILVNRDINDPEDIERFLDPKLDRLYPPKLMLNLVESANIIIDKINEGKRIRIVGDFDVDGVISVYVLYKGLLRLGALVDYVIPDRIMDGYGINSDIVKNAKDEGIDTIITCDNGIAAIEAISLAKELGLNVIITDHHEVPEICPDADAIVNPKQHDCNYPFKLLCGAGVAYKLIDYLYSIKGIDKEESYKFLEYVAIATVCDVVDLVDENRIIVKKGLELLNSTSNIGLKALIKESGISEKNIGVYHLGFIIGPTINASGRLDSALLALELLLCNDINIATEMAQNLRKLNEERKTMTQEGINKAVNIIENSSFKKDKVLVVYEPEIHESIAGIIAGRIKEKYYMPTIILTNGQDGVKGSGRSIEEYNMFEELNKCKELLKRFGGHPMAAGLSLDYENIEILRRELNQKTSLTEEDLIPKVYIDVHLPLEHISFKLVEELKMLEPFGKGNSKPLFAEKNLKINRGFILGANKNVLKLSLQSKSGITIDGLYFGDIGNFEEDFVKVYSKDALNNLYRGIDENIYIDVIYNPSINEYMGRISLQLIIESYRFK